MRVTGSIDVDGVKLVVDVDVPDGMTQVFVTNISPDCLVIPKSRWPITLLELGSMSVQVLQQAGLMTLENITDEQWNVRLPESLQPLVEEVTKAVQRLRAVALTFEAEESTAPTDYREGFPIAIGDSVVAAAGETSLLPPPENDPMDRLIESMTYELPKRLVRIFHDKGIKTVRDLIALGRRKVVFTKGVTAADIDLLDVKLKSNNITGWM